MQDSSNDYVTRVLRAPSDVDANAWNALLDRQASTSPFMRHEYLAALHASGSATARTGWDPHFVTLWRGDELHAACPLYLKSHSYGEYVFDWAWANAYEQHGLRYYPKALTAVPFTPVPGPRLLARDGHARAALVQAVLAWCRANKRISSFHLLFGDEADVEAASAAGLMLRHTVQFHWRNVAPRHGADAAVLPPEGARFGLGRPGAETAGYADFDAMTVREPLQRLDDLVLFVERARYGRPFAVDAATRQAVVEAVESWAGVLSDSVSTPRVWIARVFPRSVFDRSVPPLVERQVELAGVGEVR